MSDLKLQIDRVVVETHEEQSDIRAAEPTVREAFRLLAQRLKQTPFDQWGQARERLFETLRVAPMPLDELMGPRGADRLAQQMYNQLIRSRR